MFPWIGLRGSAGVVAVALVAAVGQGCGYSRSNPNEREILQGPPGVSAENPDTGDGPVGASDESDRPSRPNRKKRR